MGRGFQGPRLESDRDFSQESLVQNTLRRIALDSFCCSFSRFRKRFVDDRRREGRSLAFSFAPIVTRSHIKVRRDERVERLKKDEQKEEGRRMREEKNVLKQRWDESR